MSGGWLRLILCRIMVLRRSGRPWPFLPQHCCGGCRYGSCFLVGRCFSCRVRQVFMPLHGQKAGVSGTTVYFTTRWIAWQRILQHMADPPVAADRERKAGLCLRLLIGFLIKL